MLIARAILNLEGVLQQADPPLVALQIRAGGTADGGLAVPEMAAIILQAASLLKQVKRTVIVADGEVTRQLSVDAHPAGGAIHLVVTGWETSLEPPDIVHLPDLEFDRNRLLSDGAWRTGADLRITRMAAAVDRRIGFLPATARGLAFSRVFRLVPDLTGDMPILAALAAGVPFVDQPAELIPAGAAPVLLSGYVQYDADGHFEGVLGSFQFVARERDLPAADDEAELTQLVSARLEAALRAPIGRIIEQADALALQADGALRRDYALYGGDVAAAARHLLGLVDDLGSAQAIDHAGLRVEAEPIDLADLARRAAGLLGVRMLEKEITFDLVTAPETPLALGDFGRVLQILVNVIGNAVRYSPPKAVIQVSLTPVADQVELCVRDEGKGIASADQARIFEKFERLDPSEPGGSGLGLYISRQLARAMGGDLSVASDPGRGASFILALPISPGLG